MGKKKASSAADKRHKTQETKPRAQQSPSRPLFPLPPVDFFKELGDFNGRLMVQNERIIRLESEQADKSILSDLELDIVTIVFYSQLSQEVGRRRSLDRVFYGRTGTRRTDLDLRKEEVKDLEIKVHDLVKRVENAGDSVERDRLEREEPVKEHEEREMCLVEYTQLMGNHQELEEAEKIMSAEEVAYRGIAKADLKLNADLNGCRAELDLLKAEEQGLRSEVVELRKRNAEEAAAELGSLRAALEKAAEKLTALEMESGAKIECISGLVEEEEEKIRSIEIQINGYNQKLENLRTSTEQISARKKHEILELEKEVAQLKSTESALQDSCRDHAREKEKFRAQRNAVQKGLLRHKEREKNLKSRAGELQKRLEWETKENDAAHRCIGAAEQGLRDIKRRTKALQMTLLGNLF